tara:strand:+ start:247 stop:465 length:219 start_codon:yes stop_codon:yes gene_type:complete
MAWQPVTGSSIWEYDDSATASDTYSDAPGVYASGIRTFTRPNGKVQETYVKCRMKTLYGVVDNVERGELAKL